MSVERSVQLVGGVLAAMVALNAIVEFRDKSYIAVDDQAAKEMAYWDGLRDKYLTVISNIDGEDLRFSDESAILSICELALREPSDLEQRNAYHFFAIEDSGYKAKKIEQFDEVRKLLAKIIERSPRSRNLGECPKFIGEFTPQMSVPKPATEDAAEAAPSDTGEAVAEASMDEPDMASAVETPASVPPPIPVPQTPRSVARDQQLTQSALRSAEKGEQVTRKTLTVAGNSRSGYRLDIFWCEREFQTERENRNFILANRLSTELKSLSDRRFSIGQMRIRPLSVATQAQAGYPDSGFQIRGEASEAVVRDGVTAFLNGRRGIPEFTSYRSGTRTPNYISAFVCG